jgi:hypothetical protein
LYRKSFSFFCYKYMPLQGVLYTYSLASALIHRVARSLVACPIGP